MGPINVDWTLNVAAYGIKMSAVLEGDDKSMSVLRAAEEEEKIKSDGGLAKGSWLLGTAGQIVVKLDNSYSYMRSKQVKLHLTLRPVDPSPDAIKQRFGQ